MLRRVVLLALLSVGACSTVETSGAGLSAAGPQGSNERIQLKVRTGNAEMDKIVYELAYQQFSEVMPLRETEPYTGSLEVTFSSSTQSAFLGSSQSYSVGHVDASAWYTGSSATGHATVSGTTSTFHSAMTFDWQNSTMLAVLRRGDGERLWSADYSYKGGWELSGWVVNTPEEAARLVAKRLKGQYLKDTHKAG